MNRYGRNFSSGPGGKQIDYKERGTKKKRDGKTGSCDALEHASKYGKGIQSTLEGKRRQRVIDNLITSLKTKFKNFLEEYYIREKHFNAVCKTKDAEYALMKAKYEEALEINRKKEAALNDTHALLARALERESHINHQNDIYGDKLKKAETTLSKSNDMFEAYRNRLDEVC